MFGMGLQVRGGFWESVRKFCFVKRTTKDKDLRGVSLPASWQGNLTLQGYSMCSGVSVPSSLVAWGHLP